ncbi:MAG TPA: type II toxin-antitoxin system prevent-host-death family antitoxin [Rhizomicrobium sp.]|jgi:prevent-host-death family protein|nr:type II toxin-antitoxin system prevent-host-death family antitoxin [Rhizomicrobium sp.]
MAKLTATAGELVRQFSHYSDLALAEPVIVTKNGRPRNVLISVDEYERLKRRDRVAVKIEDLPEEFIPQLEAIARGEIP